MKQVAPKRVIATILLSLSCCLTGSAVVAQRPSNAFLGPFWNQVHSELGWRTVQLMRGGATDMSLNSQEATDIIRAYLLAKREIFAEPFDRQLLQEFTTGERLSNSLTAIEWLENNNGFYTFSEQSVDALESFVTEGDRATIRVTITESRELIVNDQVDASSSGRDTDTYEYILVRESGGWRLQ